MVERAQRMDGTATGEHGAFSSIFGFMRERTYC